MNLGLLKHIGPAIYPQLVERDKYGPYNILKIFDPQN